MKRAEVDGGKRTGVASNVAETLKALERENREFRQGQEDKETAGWIVSATNEILSRASAYFAQSELERPFKQ